MKIIIIVAIVVLIFGIYTKNTREEVTPPILTNQESLVPKYKKIAPEKAKEMMSEEGIIILDVRTPEEYAQEHIEGALLIPNYDLQSAAETKLPDKDATILVYCRSGSRSKGASKVLVDMGYTNINDFGGINGWTYDTVKGE